MPRVTSLLAVALATTALTVVSPLMPARAQSASPSSSALAAMAKPDVDMAKVLAALQALDPKPIETLSPSEARRQYGAADAVKKVIKDEKLDVHPHAGLSVSNSHFADMGNLRLRFYVPEKADKTSNLPIVVFFRGGGWVIADLDAYDASAAALARKTGAAVISVDYPMAPEHKFPAAHDEAVEAYAYILRSAKGWGYNPDKIALVGESAGGNLAVATAIAARDRKMTPPVAVVSVYPVATTALGTPSETTYASAKPLNTPMLGWFFSQVLPNDAAKSDPRLNLVAADLKGLPPTTVINAEIDPLASDGDMLSEKLQAAGVPTTHKVYSGVTHEFFGMDAVVAKAGEAQDFAVAQLKKAFGNGS